MKDTNKIVVKKASEHNLQNIDVSIPKNQMTVVTGVSGSGKSSLAFDTIFREGQRRYLESFSSYARSFLGKAGKPSMESISGLLPSISIDQKTTTANSRSTVGTLSEIYDFLRLLFARLGKSDQPYLKLDRSLFSFNSPHGACPICKGLGVQDRIDPDLLISDPTKTVRDGAFAMTTPSGYIVYSQVTMDVLNDVCNAHDFSVDIPWQELTEEQKKVILHGSNRIKVPFGKHPLENRLKWSGITAKPRDEGFYTGIVTIMEDILKRDRNGNILRFARSITCPSCNGTRLNSNALSVKFNGKNIADLNSLSLLELDTFLSNIELKDNSKKIADLIISEIAKRIKILDQLGLGYLTLDRESTTLSGGEAQRIRLAIQTLGDLQNVLYVLDEPSIGLHPQHNGALISALAGLQQKGNTLLVVEHDEDFIRNSTNLIDIGPKAGIEGGELLYSGKTSEFFKEDHPNSLTWKLLKEDPDYKSLSLSRSGSGKVLQIKGAVINNLQNVDASFKLGCLNVVCGVSGAGKSSLIEQTLVRALRQKLYRAKEISGKHDSIEGIEDINKIIDINQSPIGRTPRSNPATYTKLFDHIRGLFAEQPMSKENGWKKNRFSFNVKGGRCEHCQGAGIQEIGMHFLNNISVPCQHCNGKRFNAETLEAKYKGKSIFDVLKLSIQEAAEFFEENKKISKFLSALLDLGLGYIKLGQPSTTLSGGEAQRVKLASELAKPDTGSTLYILDEPTTGLHLYDIIHLLKALHKLVDSGNTVIIIEHHPQIIFSADHILELGPGSGDNGGTIIFSGTAAEMLESNNSVYVNSISSKVKPEFQKVISTKNFIELENVSTHNLKNISLKIPHNKLTVITGVSGSGKSSLAFDTIFAEGHKRFTESLSTYARRFMKNLSQPEFDKLTGLSPTIAINQRSRSNNPRSTVGTFTEIYDLLRLLFARASTNDNSKRQPLSNEFSFNHEAGACPVCKGLRNKMKPDPIKIVSNPEKSLIAGALNGTKTGKFYGDPWGQHVAILKAVGIELNFDFSKPWNELSTDEQKIAMYGTGKKSFDVNWQFKRKNREGEHKWKSDWLGFCGYIEEEYQRKHQDKRGIALLPLFSSIECETCSGSGLKREILNYKIAGLNIYEFTLFSIKKISNYLSELNLDYSGFSTIQNKVINEVNPFVQAKLQKLIDVGLGYLTLARKTDSLSGGELHRLQLTVHSGGNLTGVTYILDEPTIGLHPRDTEKMISTLKELRDKGNTVLVVEHDKDMISNADHLIELGPEAGTEGGKILANCAADNLEKLGKTQTYQYINGKKKLHQSTRRSANNTAFKINGANANNLKNIDVTFYKGLITTITGVSGSGKSSLLFDVIYNSFKNKRISQAKSIVGFEQFDSVVLVDQQPIAKSSVSTPATFSGVFDRIRKLFAATELAKSFGINHSNFSYLNKVGQCSNCKGLGYKEVSMDFLSDVQLECDVCHGKRYKEEILNIPYIGSNISEVLDMTIKNSAKFFSDNNRIIYYLQILTEVGLGYLTLGQPLNTLSGGENQRLKLAKALLDSKQDQQVLYLLDEPSTGLHFADISKLLILLEKIRDAGNTIIIVEHNTDIIKASDWVIDLGPEGGDEGGYLLASCPPEELKDVKESITGRYL
jgi:excinuclease ABC subunit A